MKRIGITLCMAILLGLPSCARKTGYYSFDGYAQGSTYHIVLETTGDALYQREIDSIFAAVDNSLSIYNPKSTVSKINANTDMKADSIFIQLFSRSRELFKETEGKVDIGAAPLFDFWGFGSAEDTLFMKMSSDRRAHAVDSIRQLIGIDRFSISSGNVVKPSPGSKINFNSVAQGYTCDVMGEFLESRGISNYLVEVGGEIICKGVNRKSEPWAIAIDRPFDGNLSPGENIQEIIKVTDRGIVTSGNYRKYIMNKGEKISHTIDPSTGYPTRNGLLSATVIAKDATTADAYATWFMVIGPEKAKMILNRNEDLEGYLIFSDPESENGMSVFYSSGLKILTTHR